MALDLEKLRSIGHISRRSGDRVREGTDEQGNRYKATTDDLGNTVTQRGDGRQDVTINAPRLVARSDIKELRD